MPFTLLHIGPALVLTLIFFNYLDFPSLFLASIIPDFAEPFLHLFFDHHDPLIIGLSHRFFHSFLGATSLAFLTALIIYPFRGRLDKILNKLNLSQKYSLIKIFYTSLIGSYLHIFLDSINIEPMLEIYSIILIAGLILLLLRILRYP